MSGGSLRGEAVSGRYFSLGHANASTGIFNQTGGILDGYWTYIAWHTNSYGAWTMSGNSVATANVAVAQGVGSVGTLTLSGNAVLKNRSSGAEGFAVGNASGAVGSLYVRDQALINMDDDGARRSLILGASGGSTGRLEMTGGVITNVNTLRVGSLGWGQARVGGDGQVYGNYVTICVTNNSCELVLADQAAVLLDEFTTIAAAEGSEGTLILTNAARFRCGAGATDTLRLGCASNGTGRIRVDGGTLDVQSGSARGIRLGYAAGSRGIVTVTSGVFSNYSTAAFSVGYAAGSAGDVYLRGGLLYVGGPTTLGASAGAVGRAELTGGTWSQAGSLSLGGVADATGIVTVAGTTQAGVKGSLTVGAAGYGLLTVSNATLGPLPGAVKVGDGGSSRGCVELVGTQRWFTCNTLNVTNQGSVINRVRAHAGGVDITNRLSTALLVTTGGNIHLSFDQNPVETGDFWGLRWAGTNGYGRLVTYTNDGRLTVANNLTGPFAGSTISVYTNVAGGVTNT
jgi:hypothetical protein